MLGQHRYRGDRNRELAEDLRDVDDGLAQIERRHVARHHDGAAGRQVVVAEAEPGLFDLARRAVGQHDEGLGLVGILAVAAGLLDIVFQGFPCQIGEAARLHHLTQDGNRAGTLRNIDDIAGLASSGSSCGLLARPTRWDRHDDVEMSGPSAFWVRNSLTKLCIAANVSGAVEPFVGAHPRHGDDKLVLHVLGGAHIAVTFHGRGGLAQEHRAIRIGAIGEPPGAHHKIGQMLTACDLIDAGEPHFALHRHAAGLGVGEDLVEAELVAWLDDIAGEHALAQRQPGTLGFRPAAL